MIIAITRYKIIVTAIRKSNEIVIMMVTVCNSI